MQFQTDTEANFSAKITPKAPFIQSKSEKPFDKRLLIKESSKGPVLAIRNFKTQPQVDYEQIRKCKPTF